MFKKTFIGVLALVSILALAGCATSNADKGFSFAQNQGMGLLVGSLTAKDPGNVFSSDINMYFTSQDPKLPEEHVKINSQCSAVQLNSSDFKDVCGHLFVFVLPAGEYELSNWNIWPTLNRVQSPARWDAPTVTVQAGKATYVGDIHMVFDPSIPGPGVKEFHAWPVDYDQRDRDIPLLLSQYPGLKPDDVVVSLIRFPLPTGMCSVGGAGAMTFKDCGN